MSSGAVAAGKSIEEQGIEDHRQREKLKQIERSDQARIGFPELPDEALNGVEQDEQVEGAAAGPLRPPGESGEVEAEEGEHRQALVELDRVAADAVAEIDAPGERGGRAVGLVRQAGEKAADAADRDAERERADPDQSGRTPDAARQLVELDRDDAAGERAGDAVRGMRHGKQRRVPGAERPGAADRPDRERDDVERAGMDDDLSGDPLQPPMVEQDREQRRGPPGEKVEEEVNGQAGLPFKAAIASSVTALLLGRVAQPSAVRAWRPRASPRVAIRTSEAASITL